MSELGGSSCITCTNLHECFINSLQVIDTMAMHLPPEKFIPPLVRDISCPSVLSGGWDAVIETCNNSTALKKTKIIYNLAFLSAVGLKYCCCSASLTERVHMSLNILPTWHSFVDLANRSEINCKE